MQVSLGYLLNDQGEVLIAQRPADKSYGGLWEFPGGKHEPSESPSEALVRELHEELDIHVTALESLDTYRFSINDSLTIEFHPIVVELMNGTLTPHEHTKTAWVKPDDLEDYNLAPPDYLAVRLLHRYLDDQVNRNRNHSRPLDVHRWSDYPEVNDWVYAFWDEHLAGKFQATGGKKPLAKSKYQFKAFILDLYVAWLTDPNLLIGVGMSNEDYQPSSRYNELHISKDTIKFVKELHKLGFINKWTGSELSGYNTRIWPLPSLTRYFRKAGFSEFDIGYTISRECIVLAAGEVLEGENEAESNEPDSSKAKKPKTKKLPPIDYSDSDYTPIPSMRASLNAYNALLNRTFVDIGSLQTPGIEAEHWNRKRRRWEKRHVQIRQNNKFVRRIFYRGSWELGGRFHGGWWQQIRSECRRDILINDEYTVEVDYSGFHVALAFALEGHQPPEDPYKLNTLLQGYTREQQRKDVKLLALTAINAKDRKSAFNAFRDERNKDKSKPREISYTDELLTQLLSYFLEENSEIKHYLCSDKGVEMMNLDGKITSDIIDHFTSKSIPILTVHDSYIVAAQYEEEMMRTMRSAAQRHTGNRGFVLKQNEQSPHRIQTFMNIDTMQRQQHAKELLTLSDSIKRCDGYQRRLRRYKRWQQELRD